MAGLAVVRSGVTYTVVDPRATTSNCYEVRSNFDESIRGPSVQARSRSRAGPRSVAASRPRSDPRRPNRLCLVSS